MGTDAFLLETFYCLRLKGLALRHACNDLMHKNCKRFFFSFFEVEWEVATPVTKKKKKMYTLKILHLPARRLESGFSGYNQPGDIKAFYHGAFPLVL